LAVTTVAVVVIAAILPFTPVAVTLGFVPLPARFFGFLAGIVGCYLICVEMVKRRLLRRHGA
jgi:P-type Mg2+ transporter